MKISNDLRSQYSQKLIKDTLIQLLEEKNLEDISVKELCDKAQINRGTFYNHFENINDAYETIQKDFYDSIVARLDNKKITDIDGSFFSELMQFIFQNQIVVKKIIKEFSTSKLLKDLIAYTLNKFINEFKEEYPAIPEKNIKDLSLYIINGTVGIIVDIVEEDKFDEIETYSELIININRFISENFVAEMKK